jgi:hypothetical protein
MTFRSCGRQPDAYPRNTTIAAPATKAVKRKRNQIHAPTIVPLDHWARRGQLDRRGNRQHQYRQQGQPSQRNDIRIDGLQSYSAAAGPQLVGKDQLRWQQFVHAHPITSGLVQFRDALNFYAAELEIQEFSKGHAVAALVNPHYNAIRADFGNNSR